LFKPAPAPTQTGGVQPPNETPQPDVLLPDGSLGYSGAAMQKLMAFQQQQLTQQLEQKFTERFGGIERDWKVQKHLSEALPRVQAQIADAEKNWPGFADAKKEIHAAMQADRSLNLQSAYIKVVVPKLSASRDDVRKSVLAELNQKPKAASVQAPTGAPSMAADGGGSIKDVIREASTSIFANQ
jgi:hypothetical protein